MMSEAIYQFLIMNGYHDVVVSGRAPVHGFTPQVIFADITTVRHALLCQYPDAKLLLVDTGAAPEQLLAVLLSLPVQALLSTHTEMPLLEKALKAIVAGQIWIDNELVKALLLDPGALSKTGKINGLTDREQEIIRMHLRGIKQQADLPETWALRKYGEGPPQHHFQEAQHHEQNQADDVGRAKSAGTFSLILV